MFDRILAALAAGSEATGTVMIDATHLKAHPRTAASSLRSKRGCSPPVSGAPRAGHQLQAARGLRRRWQALDPAAHRGPGQRLSRRRHRPAGAPGRRGPLIADKGYDSNWFRDALSELEIEPPASRAPVEPQGADPLQCPTSTNSATASERMFGVSSRFCRPHRNGGAPSAGQIESLPRRPEVIQCLVEAASRPLSADPLSHAVNGDRAGLSVGR